MMLALQPQGVLSLPVPASPLILCCGGWFSQAGRASGASL